MGLDLSGAFHYPNPDPAWLALSDEEVLAPDLPVIDAHHHLWEQPGNVYLLDDLLADLNAGHNIIATVFAQCYWHYRDSGPAHLRPVGETEMVEALRCQGMRLQPQRRACSAIVGFVDLLAGDSVDAALDAHFAASPGHFRGVRHTLARDSHFPDGIVTRPAPAGMMADPAFREGLRRVGRRGLSFDAMIYHQQLRDLVDLAQACDDVTIILDHYGCPLGVGFYQGRQNEVFADWRRDMAALARCPNVRIKLGGFGLIMTGSDYHLRKNPPRSQALADNWRPFFDVCVTEFGTDRCMFESNFPVDKAMYSYKTLWNACKRLASGASATETANLFSETAARTYRIERGDPAVG